MASDACDGGAGQCHTDESSVMTLSGVWAVELRRTYKREFVSTSHRELHLILPSFSTVPLTKPTRRGAGSVAASLCLRTTSSSTYL